MTQAGGRSGLTLVLTTTVAMLVALVLPAGGITTTASLERPAATTADAPVADEVRTQLAESGRTSFWVRFESRSRLADAAAEPNWADRGRAVVSALEANAEESQAEVRRLLTGQGVEFTPFWVVNAMKVTAGADVVDLLVEQPGVAEIVADRSYELPLPIGGDEQPRVQAVEWNVDKIRAPEVWSGLGTRGEGIVIGSIDTGVQFDHPALVGSYRGNQGGGVFDHDYNWFDPSNVCGDPSTVPCDNHSHGTHTMGTMVGDDGAGNQTGVAPGARWMTAKGCESTFCSDEALIAAGQWMLAPTDLSGANPRPDLRPNVVNNSWGNSGTNPFYQEIVAAWVAAGIFPVFANGNDGPNCRSVGSPADYPESYSVGAFSRDDTIAPFSSRGPGDLDGAIRPDISAPGVDVRSSGPGGGYEVHSGTSMAAPHVTATVALMWSASPAIDGHIDETRALLDQTALDRPDGSCGGALTNNNVWGEGALDAFSAVDHAPKGSVGTLTGIVTESATGAPVAGARVHLAGPSDRVAVTDAAGAYRSTLATGDYAVDVTAFGFRPATAEVTVADGATVTLDVGLSPAPRHTVSGSVRDHRGAPVVGATVTVSGTPLPPVMTAADGSFTIPDVPEETYSIEAVEGRCLASQVRTVTVDGDETVDFELAPRPDAAGYTCEEVPADFVEGHTVVPVFGQPGFPHSVEVELPFPFEFYGRSYSTTFINSRGLLTFEAMAWPNYNSPIPFPPEPNAAIYAFHDEIWMGVSSAVRTEVLGEAPHRSFVVEWRDMSIAGTETVTFEAILSEDGGIETRYRVGDGPRGRGATATVGIENASGDVGLQYSYAQSVLRNGVGVRFHAPPSGFIEGRVTDAADGGPRAGAAVRALSDGAEVSSTATADNGTYLLRVAPGTYTVEASFNGQGTETTTVVVDGIGDTAIADFELAFSRIEVAPAALNLTVPAGQTRERTITIESGGQAPLEFEIGERPMPPGDGGAVTAGKATRPHRSDSSGSMVDAPWTPGDRVLLVRDVLPWDSSAMTQLLDANAVAYDVVTSARLARIDVTAYKAVIISNAQNEGFNNNLRAAMGQLTAFVEQGGLLWVGAAMAFSDDLAGTELPGGATIRSWGHQTNDVVEPDHPAMDGVPDPFGGDWASNASFDSLPAGTQVIARGLPDLQPTMVEYDLGIGQVLASSQNLEYAWERDQDGARILENLVPYVAGHETFVDVPWLSIEPTSGSVAPGASRSVAVTVDTTGLAPGVHGANVIVRSSDPFTGQIVVPVTVVVPAHQVAVDAGATSPFTDAAGDSWAADRAYAEGQWGYTSPSSGARTTARAIAETEEDRLFQTARLDPVSYRFDSLPEGTYEVDIRSAETDGRRPGRRSFDVYLDDQLVLPSHDIAGEVGTYTADRHTLFVEVTDGRLDVSFVPLLGFGRPIVNALRVTHRSDR